MTTEGEPTADAAVRVETHTVGGSVRELRVEVDPARVRRAFDEAYRGLARQVRVRGFRPGKAPRSVLEKLYGGAVGEEVERSLVRETLPGAIEQAGVVPVTEPGIDCEALEPGAPFVYTARLEIKPQIELPEVQGLRARRPQVEVGDEEVERELENLRERHAVLQEEPAGTPIARGHVVSVNFEGEIDGKPFEGGSGRDARLEIGSGRALPELEEGLVGAAAGERRRIPARFPDDHPRAALAGKAVEFEVEVLSVQRRELPALDDELAKDAGDFESLDALRQRIREDLQAGHERQARAVLRRTLLDSLLERVQVEVPPGAVERRLRRRLAGAEQELGGSLPADALQARLARWEEEWRPLAEREIREEWVLEAVARQQGLSVEDEALERHLAMLAEQQQTSPARLRKAYEKSGLLDGLRAHLLEERALEFLLGEATVEATDA